MGKAVISMTQSSSSTYPENPCPICELPYRPLRWSRPCDRCKLPLPHDGIGKEHVLTTYLTELRCAKPRLPDDSAYIEKVEETIAKVEAMIAKLESTGKVRADTSQQHSLSAGRPVNTNDPKRSEGTSTDPSSHSSGHPSNNTQQQITNTTINRLDTTQKNLRSDLEKVSKTVKQLEDSASSNSKKLSNIEYKLSNIEYKLSNIEYKLSNIEDELSSTKNQLRLLTEEPGELRKPPQSEESNRQQYTSTALPLQSTSEDTPNNASHAIQREEQKPEEQKQRFAYPKPTWVDRYNATPELLTSLGRVIPVAIPSDVMGDQRLGRSDQTFFEKNEGEDDYWVITGESADWDYLVPNKKRKFNSHTIKVAQDCFKFVEPNRQTDTSKFELISPAIVKSVGDRWELLATGELEFSLRPTAQDKAYEVNS